MNAIVNLKKLVSEKNLNLSVLEPDSTQRGGLLILNRGRLAGVRYRVFVHPCCNPTCGCCEVLFRCRADLADGKVATPDGFLEFWLDVQDQKVVRTTELEKAPESLRLAKDLSSALTPLDWKRLYQWLRISKLEIIRKATSSTIDVSRLPHVTDGRMISFVEVFPFGLALYFPMQDEIWAADETYCVQPNCDCKETILSFLKLQDASGANSKFVSAPSAIRYNYRTGSTRKSFPGPAGDPETAVLLAALKKEQPLLNEMLEQRHLLMQTVYRRHALEQHSKLARATTPGQRKIGRNERCPCGSGKKFKHCCLGIIHGDSGKPGNSA